MTLTKADLVEKISNSSLPKEKSSDMAEAILELMKRSLESGEDILISGFGKFSVKSKRAH